MPETILSLRGVTKHYSNDSSAGVSGVDLDIRKGEFIAIVGESGSGKSTLLKLMYGLLSPDEGQINFCEQHVPGPEEKLIPGHDSMKMLIQDFDLNTYAKVYENISSMLPNTDLEYKSRKTAEIMDLLRISVLAEKRVADLSGGEQQRAALARAIITEPEILLLDEPFSQLDSVLKTQFRADLSRLCRELGITIIMVSHDPIDGLTLADRLIILEQGRVIESGSPVDIYNNPASVYTGKLLGNAFVLSAEEAQAMRIKSDKPVLIYPEWVELKSSWSSRSFQVTDVFFRGFYEEILLQRLGVVVHAINHKPGSIRPGQNVQVVIRKYVTAGN